MFMNIRLLVYREEDTKLVDECLGKAFAQKDVKIISHVISDNQFIAKVFEVECPLSLVYYAIKSIGDSIPFWYASGANVAICLNTP